VTGAGSVGGDWYDVFVLPDGKLGASRTARSVA